MICHIITLIKYKYIIIRIISFLANIIKILFLIFSNYLNVIIYIKIKSNVRVILLIKYVFHVLNYFNYSNKKIINKNLSLINKKI
jgi:hypothetical protein